MAEAALKGYTFKDDRERVSFANQNIRNVLKKNETVEVMTGLYIALESECNALFHVLISCGRSQNGTQACKEGMEALCTALEDLVEAAMELAHGDQGNEIYGAYEKLAASKLNGGSCGWQSYHVGVNVSNALQSLSTSVQNGASTRILV
ncbi:hypothetical protein Q1695_003808 [Nippostrongylus brasiliensis]|nr:hypothetical protein Q1695_003808 [Nippostrongylus brasiliensis]